MKNIRISFDRSGNERCIATLTGEREDGTIVSEELNFSGNSIPAMLSAANLVVLTLETMEKA